MATTDLVPTSVDSATGWTGATVANLSSSNDVRATDGVAGESIDGQLTDSPGDFGSMNTIQLRVEARVVGTVQRQKTILVELLDSGDTVLTSFTTGNLTSSDVEYSGSATSRSDSAAVIDGYQYRVTVQEGGGMPDTATVEIDYIRFTLDYNIGGGAAPGIHPVRRQPLIRW